MKKRKAFLLLLIVFAIIAAACYFDMGFHFFAMFPKAGELHAEEFMRARALRLSEDNVGVSRLYEDVKRSAAGVLYMAFYFPQFHIAPENKMEIKDALDHYTDWDVLMKYKNRSLTPLEYYDLAAPDTDVFDRQDETANEYGVGAFIFYHYWNDDSLQLNLPVDHFIRKKRKTKFMFMWDNTGGFLGTQTYATPEKHAYQLLRYFMSDNYLTDVHGRKPFLIGFTRGVPRDYLRRFVTFLEMHNVVVKVGHCYMKGRNFWEMPDWSQVSSEFAPHFEDGPTRPNLYEYLPPDPTTWEKAPGKEYWQGAISSWDSRPRCSSVRTNQKRCGVDLRVPNGQVSVAGFGKLLKSIIANIHQLNKDRIVTIFAWNEWTEGAALEQSVETGLGFLEQLI